MQWFRLHMHPYHSMKHFFIITNAWKDQNLYLTKRIISYIEEKGGTAFYEACTEPGGIPSVHVRQVPEETEAVFVIGGDGTLIRAARDMVSLELPLIGINLGHLGYLCELEESTVYDAIDELFADHYTIENRMMLTGYMIAKNAQTSRRIALNDIVIHRTGSLQIVNLNVYVNGEYLCAFQADGIILATPTGSTGYNMSAGGPIVDPKAKMLLMTPINSHTLNSKSIVISADDEVVIEVGSRRSEKDEQVEVSFDGDNSMQLEVGDRIVVHRAGAVTKILKISKISFLEILRKKMQNYT